MLVMEVAKHIYFCKHKIHLENCQFLNSLFFKSSLLDNFRYNCFRHIHFSQMPSYLLLKVKDLYFHAIKLKNLPAMLEIISCFYDIQLHELIFINMPMKRYLPVLKKGGESTDNLNMSP